MTKSLNYRAAAEACAADLVASGLITDHTQALVVGLATVESLRLHWGGSEVYLPVRQSFVERAARDQSLLRRWDGTNTEQVCREFGIARRTLYSIAARSRS